MFNVSKQAVNPGPDFGAYGTSKAALMALMRQYAVEHGASGITSNAVNADRIRTGLMTDEMVAERSKARGVTPDAYMRGNLLKREVLASDVAAAFVHLVKARASTGAVVTSTAAMSPPCCGEGSRSRDPGGTDRRPRRDASCARARRCYTF